MNIYSKGGYTAIPWAISAAVTAVSGYMSARAKKQAATNEQVAANYDATLQESQAEQGAAFGAEAVRRGIAAGKRFLANARAAFGGSGIVSNTGSPLLALAYDAGQARLQALEASQRVSAGYSAGLAKARVTRWQGDLGASAANRAATASLLTTTGQLGASAFNAYNAGVFSGG